MPFIDQGAAYQKWDLTRRYAEQKTGAADPCPFNVPAYFCPSRRNPRDFSVVYNFATGAGPTLDAPAGGLGDYASVAGTANNEGAMRISLPFGIVSGAQVHGTGPFNNSGPGAIVTNFNSRSKLQTIIDGTSNTLLIGEKYIRPNSQWGKNEDRSIYDGNNQNNFRRFLGRQVTSVNPIVYDPTDPPNPIIGDPKTQANPKDPVTGLDILPNQCFGSWHSGMCMFVMCDSTVRSLSVSTTIDVLTLLCLPDDGQPVRLD
jgi:hypothetical protein